MQLSCVCGDEKFDRYVFPNSSFDAKALAVTGLHIVSGNLFYKQTKLDSVGIEICMNEFHAWLQRFHKPLLVCPNGKAFDSVVFIKTVLKHPTSGLMTAVEGFVDTLPLFKELLPNRTTYKLQSLVSETVNFPFEAHSALEDAKALQALVQHHQVTEDLLLKHSFGVDYVEASIRHKTQTEELLKSLKPLESCVSKYMLKKISMSGLSYQHLKLACERGGAEGILKILSEKNSSGTVRVTKNKSIIEQIFSHFN